MKRIIKELPAWCNAYACGDWQNEKPGCCDGCSISSLAIFLPQIEENQENELDFSN